MPSLAIETTTLKIKLNNFALIEKKHSGILNSNLGNYFHLNSFPVGEHGIPGPLLAEQTAVSGDGVPVHLAHTLRLASHTSFVVIRLTETK